LQQCVKNIKRQSTIADSLRVDGLGLTFASPSGVVPSKAGTAVAVEANVGRRLVAADSVRIGEGSGGAWVGSAGVDICGQRKQFNNEKTKQTVRIMHGELELTSDCKLKAVAQKTRNSVPT
jgi:hypothetical protein